MKNNWFSIYARGENSPVEIFIFDQIGKSWFSNDGVSAKEFVTALAEYQNRDLTVRINSPGGNVFDGLAIYNALKMHKGHVETRIEGLAASIAGVVALAGKQITMAESAMAMIHNPSMLAEGDADELRDKADMLDKIGNQLAGIYSARSGKTQDEALGAMNKTTWFTAQEAKDWGLVDEITAPLKAAAAFNLSAFKNVPVALSNLPADVHSLRAEINTAKAQNQKLAKRMVAMLVAGTDCSDATYASLVQDCITNPVATETHIRQMLEIGQLNSLAGEPIGPDFQGLSTTLENAHKNYSERLKKFRKY